MQDSDNTVPSWPFRATGKGQLLAATTASSSVTIMAGERLEGTMIANLTTSWAWANFGQGSATAAFPTAGTPKAGVPIAPGTQISVQPPNEPVDSSAQAAVYDTVAVVLQSGAGTVLVVPGVGSV
ncbi:hypothetical protein F4827_004514 [Paraburkholderia bannensis]|uniref:Uncharacterized protein n=1 Tax=Paraburkholderia bannensis TaxID=765414 RepID=A0A7W9WSU2_9BURK|nr:MULTISPECIES: hypothetical protein [Paraburkholderia]MBB3259639.1 hypothetical protein [Paraburkholderia sp. WP4_3_2]MBB6104655.1 hypothetical protein [Paraburkholderia bannensis]